MTMTDLKDGVKRVLRKACAVVAPCFSRISELDAGSARTVLEACTPDPIGSAMTENGLKPVTCDLQIIIPAYNAEAYLEECLHSVLSQETRYTYHVVMVDDGAKDATPQICDRFREDPRVTVIHQENRGHAGARNTGLRELFGRYIMFVDSDDRLCPGAIEGLLNTAYDSGCDIAEGGAYYLIDGKQSYMYRYERDERIENPYEILHGQPWGKVYKRELFADRHFPEGYWYEDSVMAFLIFPEAECCYASQQMTYVYRINQQGIVKTSVGKPRAVETYYICEMLLKERERLGYPMDAEFFHYMMRQIRLNQLRLAELDERVQESAFVLTCGLLEKYFPTQAMLSSEKQLVKALRTRDFGMFTLCCKFY